MKAPWDNHLAFKSDDGHGAAVESFGQEADLFHKRFSKRNDFKDLHAQAEKFRSERDAMGILSQCLKHVDEYVSYSKQVFAFSLGQMRQSISRAIRSFANTDGDPDLDAYKSLMAMRIDLLGDASAKFLAQVDLSPQLALFMSDDATEDDDEDDMDGDDAMHSSKSEEEEDMKEEDVKAAVDIALQMQEAGLIQTQAEFVDVMTALAKMTSEDRAQWVKMTSNLSGSPAKVLTNKGAAAAEGNLVAVGTRMTVGRVQKQTAGRMLPLFMSGAQAPIFDGNF